MLLEEYEFDMPESEKEKYHEPNDKAVEDFLRISNM